MIEPTETETKETLDRFCEAMIAIAEEAEADPAALQAAPTKLPVRRLDEVNAAKNPVVRWRGKAEPRPLEFGEPTVRRARPTA